MSTTVDSTTLPDGAEVSTPSPVRPLTPIKEDHDGGEVGKTESKTESHDEGIVLHSYADTIFSVKGKTGDAKTLNVILAMVSAVSVVFRALVDGTGHKKKSDGTTIIEVTDDPEAFTTIMNIAHFLFSKVPAIPSIDQLYQISLITSKYKCTHLTFPWASLWVSQLVNFASDETASVHNYKAAWIAWEFGCVELLRQMTDSLILTSKVDADGDLVHPTGAKLKDLVLPPGLLDRIVDIRFRTLSKLLEKIRVTVDHVSGINRQSGLFYCRLGTDAEKCEAMLFGSAMPRLIQAQLFPVPEASAYRGSLSDLKDHIYAIEYHHWEGRGYQPHKSHNSCNLGLKGSVKAVLDSMADAVQHSHLEHLASQADISGFDNGDALLAFRSKLSPLAAEYKPSTGADTDISTLSVKADSTDGVEVKVEPKSEDEADKKVEDDIKVEVKSEETD